MLKLLRHGEARTVAGVVNRVEQGQGEAVQAAAFQADTTLPKRSPNLWTATSHGPPKGGFLKGTEVQK